jgi:hypothetical protein
MFDPTGTRTPAPLGRPVRSQWLYRLSYPGSIYPHKNLNKILENNFSSEGFISDFKVDMFRHNFTFSANKFSGFRGFEYPCCGLLCCETEMLKRFKINYLMHQITTSIC